MNEKLDLDFDQIQRYLINGYKSLYKQNSTFYKNLSEVGRGQWIKINNKIKITKSDYWNFNLKVDKKLSYKDSVDKIREELLRSVSIRLRSDVPIAFCMSGGIDSNALISIAARQKGFNVHGFTIVNSDERYNETPLVKKSVEELEISHTQVQLDKKNFFRRIKKTNYFS